MNWKDRFFGLGDRKPGTSLSAEDIGAIKTMTHVFGEMKRGLAVAADAVSVASDWHLEEVQISPPRNWELDAVAEDPQEGWCSTSGLARKLKELSRI